MIEAFLDALGRRRATGESVGSDACSTACVRQMATWGARRALVPDEPWLASLGLPDAIRDAGIDVVTWPSERGWRELLGLDGAPPTCAVTVPIGAVAERGTLLVGSSPTHGRSLDAVGWWHLAVLRGELLSPTLATALTAAYAADPPPSAISLVSGPSRTSDVEKITTYGAHGALAEHVLVVVRSSPFG